MRSFAVKCSLMVLVAGRLCAQSFSTSPCGTDQGNTNTNWFFDHGERVCEMRRATLPPSGGVLRVTAKNGGIEVVGEERQDIALEARVVAQASDRESALALARQVKIVTTGDIHAEGPEEWGFSRRSWYVNLRLHVPKRLSARLHTENGGIDVSNLEGVIKADTTNGGLVLDGLAGDVHATTVNGGLDVKLAGNQWHGAGLVAKSTNGGVSVKASDHYSAHLVAATVNGRVSLDFPVTVQGPLNRNRVDTNLGQGGSTVQFETVNGGVSIGN